MKTEGLIQNFRETAKILKKSKLNGFSKSETFLNNIKNILNLETIEESLVLAVLIDRQCCGQESSIDDLATYLNCSSLDIMQFVPAINKLTSKGFLSKDPYNEPNILEAEFSIESDVFSSIIDGREINPVPVIDNNRYDQFDFCKKIDNLFDDRQSNRISTQKLFSIVMKMEEEHKDLDYIKEVTGKISEVKDRVFFYDMCYDFSSDPTTDSDINETLDYIYDRITDRADMKVSIIKGTSHLIESKLIYQSGDDKVSLTNEGIKLLFGEVSEAYVNNNVVKDRYEFVSKFADLVDEISYRNKRYDIPKFHNDFIQLENNNSQLSAVTNIKNLIPDMTDRIIFYLTCNEFLSGNTYSIKDLDDVFMKFDSISIQKTIKSGSNNLIKKDLIAIKGNAFFDGVELDLTNKGQSLFLENDINLFENQVSNKELIYHDKIKEKQLYFEPKTQKQLSLLEDSLNESNYQKLCERLEAKGMSKGVAVLFYGSPGTGKTESVMQIARRTGREIMHVDISATKSCWFGESEKKIKEVFDKYSKLVTNNKVKPILLFNEADAIFSKRKDSNFSNVAQTENAIQNIILEEIEKLDGILIATTNLADNLDKAFERRFLFKIRFDKPSVESKQKIWLDKMPSLSEENSMILAKKYDFSGGEIDNIVRKAVMSEIIEGEVPSIERLTSLCDEEKIANARNKIGFCI